MQTDEKTTKRTHYSPITAMKANVKLANMGDWQTRHNNELHRSVRPFVTAMVRMIENWAQYAHDHKAEYDSLIGNDGVLGEHWADIGKGLIGLLNGRTGELDAGTLDTFIRETMQANGIDGEE